MTQPQSTNYLDRYDADSLPDFDECVVESGEQIRFTAKGRLRYGERFGKVGIDNEKQIPAGARKKLLRRDGGLLRPARQRRGERPGKGAPRGHRTGQCRRSGPAIEAARTPEPT